MIIFARISCFSECNRIYLLFFTLYFSCRDHILNFATAIVASTIASVHLNFIYTRARVNLQTVIKLRNVRRNLSSSWPEIENWRAIQQHLNWAHYSFDRNLRYSRIILSLSLPLFPTILYLLMELPANTRVGEAEVIVKRYQKETGMPFVISFSFVFFAVKIVILVSIKWKYLFLL